mmetsp:Transcript_558/g.997  ORF Transcript_558/g.997 Transcript_558/m.997 type:complete len:369 (-) Transcript_558:128-1234(-)|eukprot:CAMPEP_0182500988 /NCGR_PEP_ID=MMETSP1321-20130603/10357_1 /TAXON_ID=91990 /ORGANISM="Bolidomonas sp., Strain RCC1657" /LENGTH=368 /DNA_ID=CAMNT_0024705569 /DNA_START=100 /DNA_END=1206 /DNA_ORIENTATION=+
MSAFDQFHMLGLNTERTDGRKRGPLNKCGKCNGGLVSASFLYQKLLPSSQAECDACFALCLTTAATFFEGTVCLQCEDSGGYFICSRCNKSLRQSNAYESQQQSGGGGAVDRWMQGNAKFQARLSQISADKDAFIAQGQEQGRAFAQSEMERRRTNVARFADAAQSRLLKSNSSTTAATSQHHNIATSHRKSTGGASAKQINSALINRTHQQNHEDYTELTEIGKSGTDTAGTLNGEPIPNNFIDPSLTHDPQAEEVLKRCNTNPNYRADDDDYFVVFRSMQYRELNTNAVNIPRQEFNSIEHMYDPNPHRYGINKYGMTRARGETEQQAKDRMDKAPGLAKQFVQNFEQELKQNGVKYLDKNGKWID